MNSNARKFLIRYFSPRGKCTNFNVLTYEVYHTKKFQFGLEKFHVTSECIKQHVLDILACGSMRLLSIIYH